MIYLVGGFMKIRIYFLLSFASLNLASSDLVFIDQSRSSVAPMLPNQQSQSFVDHDNKSGNLNNTTSAASMPAAASAAPRTNPGVTEQGRSSAASMHQDEQNQFLNATVPSERNRRSLLVEPNRGRIPVTVFTDGVDGDIVQHQSWLVSSTQQEDARKKAQWDMVKNVFAAVGVIAVLKVCVDYYHTNTAKK